MTEQELRIEFEHEAWCDTQNNISKICNCMMSYPLEIIENLKETIKSKNDLIEMYHQEILGYTKTIEKQKKESETLDGIIKYQLDQIKSKDAEIERLNTTVKNLNTIITGNEESLKENEEAIAEAREHISLLIVMNDRDYCNGEPYEECENIKKAKAWLENNR